jgi:regulator of protease activity HflC (stomatin/prohibitin superfamily)
MDMAAALVFFMVGGGVLFFTWFLPGLFIINPRQEGVILRWGKFIEVVQKEGIHFSQPWGRRLIRVATAQNALEVPRTTVVEKNGNPIEISAVVVYHVADVRKAAIDVSDVGTYVRNQAMAVIKRVAASFPYESPSAEIPCLRKESAEVTAKLIAELQGTVEQAGVHIDSIRLNDLTYAPEIAQSMLMRQQALALVDARKTIVEGAVGMVRDCIARLRDAGFEISPSQRETLVSNLLVVLCSSEKVQPTLQIGERHNRN